MKITVEISEVEAKGLKAYLKSFDFTNPTKKEISQYIQNIVSGNLHNPKESVSTFINQQNKSNENNN